MAFDVISGSLGAAGVAMQIFEGLKTAYGYFEDAVSMPEESASLRLRLLFEYARLLDWGDESGLAIRSEHTRFDTQYRGNRPLFMAALSEMQTRLQSLAVVKDRYREIPDADKKIADAGGTATTAASPADGDTGVVTVNVHEKVVLSSASIIVPNVFTSPDAGYPGKKQSRGVAMLLRVKQAAHNVKEVTLNPKRLRWAIHDKEYFIQELTKIHELNDLLHEALGEQRAQVLLESARDASLAMVQLSREVTELRTLLVASTLGRRLNAEVSDSASVYSTTGTLVGEDNSPGMLPPLADSRTSFEQLTKFRLLRAEVEETGTESTETFIDVKELGLDVSGPLQAREVAVWSRRVGGVDDGQVVSKKVWVEWRDYEVVNIAGAGDAREEPGPEPRVTTLVKQLAILLQDRNQPPEFRIPRCLGYCQDTFETRFGFVYELDSPHAPRTLFDLLGEEMPSISSRIKTAQDLATSILFLHAVGWLHKDLRSANVLFIADTHLPDLAPLHLSGFEYSRPDQVDLTITQKSDSAVDVIYRHPDHRSMVGQQLFRKTFDIYSLGIVLLELALWRRASDIFSDTSEKNSKGEMLQPRPSSKAHAVRDWILNDPAILDSVRRAMGERYCSVVKACVTGTQAFGLPEKAEETDAIVSTQLQLSYLRLVVEVLRSIMI